MIDLADTMLASKVLFNIVFIIWKRNCKSPEHAAPTCLPHREDVCKFHCSSMFWV